MRMDRISYSPPLSCTRTYLTKLPCAASFLRNAHWSHGCTLDQSNRGSIGWVYCPSLLKWARDAKRDSTVLEKIVLVGQQRRKWVTYGPTLEEAIRLELSGHARSLVSVLEAIIAHVVDDDTILLVWLLGAQACWPSARTRGSCQSCTAGP